MGVLVGDASTTRFSYTEYQAFMVCLAAIMCIGLLIIELTMNRFQVLPLLFPGMFSIRERRFYFFDFDVSNGTLAGKLRSHAKMQVRLTLCVVLSYLWQQCVMATSQKVGTDFPKEQCELGHDCWSSEIHFYTLLQRQHTPVNCSAVKERFANRVVVSCIGFVRPSASAWLMHLAIAHSVTQLNLKVYENAVWISGNSKWVRRILALTTLLCFLMSLGLFFGGAITEFASSWLSFVTILSVPVTFVNVYQSAGVLAELWKEETAKMQVQIEAHFLEFDPTANLDDPPAIPSGPRTSHLGSQVTMRARSLLKLSGIPNMLPRGSSMHNNVDSSMSTEDMSNPAEDSAERNRWGGLRPKEKHSAEDRDTA